MTAHVFLGPTLTVDVARRELDATYHPPAQQGDVLRVLAEGPTAIGIVDGYFESVPSVWHKEVLLALEQRIPVYGAASMGALRAAELHRFGMVGVGQVFEWFRSGHLEDDDEVAVAHGPAEFGYPALSEAMVNIRDALAAAVSAGALSPARHDELVDFAKSLHYSERSYPRLRHEARERGAGEAEMRRLDDFLAASGPSLKERDAVALLRRMAADPIPPAEPDWRVERTVFLADLIIAVGQGDGTGPAPVGETVEVVRKKTLLRILARREAERSGVDVPHAAVQAASDAFREQFRLRNEAVTTGWLRMAGLTRETFRELMHDAALIDALERRNSDEVDRGAMDQARLSTVRLWSRDWA